MSPTLLVFTIMIIAIIIAYMHYNNKNKCKLWAGAGVVQEKSTFKVIVIAKYAHGYGSIEDVKKTMLEKLKELYPEEFYFNHQITAVEVDQWQLL